MMGEKNHAYWMEQARQIHEKLAKARSTVSILEYELRLCEKGIRETSGYDRIKEPAMILAAHNGGE